MLLENCPFTQLSLVLWLLLFGLESYPELSCRLQIRNKAWWTLIWGNLGKGVTTYSLVSLMYVFDQLLARYTAFPSVRWCSSAARVMMGEIRAAVLPAPAAFLAMGNPSMKWHFEAGNLFKGRGLKYHLRGACLSAGAVWVVQAMWLKLKFVNGLIRRGPCILGTCPSTVFSGALRLHPDF